MGELVGKERNKTLAKGEYRNGKGRKCLKVCYLISTEEKYIFYKVVTSKGTIEFNDFSSALGYYEALV